MNRSQTPAVFGLTCLKYREALKHPLLLPTPAFCAFVAKGSGSSYVTAVGKWKRPVWRHPSRPEGVWRLDLCTSALRGSRGLGLRKAPWSCVISQAERGAFSLVPEIVHTFESHSPL